jgi:hypothetical protein
MSSELTTVQRDCVLMARDSIATLLGTLERFGPQYYSAMDAYLRLDSILTARQKDTPDAE